MVKRFWAFFLLMAGLVAALPGCGEPPINRYALSTDVIGKGKIQMDMRSIYIDEGDSVHLTAVPGPFSRFIRWEGDAAGTDNPLTFAMTKDMNVTAVFEPAPLTMWWYWPETGPMQNPSQDVRDAFGTTVVTTYADEFPPGYSVLMLGDADCTFDIPRFNGEIIVTIDTAVDGFLSSILCRDTQGEHWDYNSLPVLYWDTPYAQPETGATGDAAIFHTLDDEPGFTRRADLLAAHSRSDADDVIIYEVNLYGRHWWWVHIGPHMGAYDESIYPGRYAHIIVEAIEIIAGQ